MNYFDEVVSPPTKNIRLPLTPTTSEIIDMVKRVEERAYATMSHPEAQDMTNRETVDPYFMVSPGDSALWWVLCSKAENISKDFYCILWYIRGCGTRLVKHYKWGYILKPDIQIGGWETLEHWERDKHLLDAWQKELMALLRELPFSGQSV